MSSRPFFALLLALLFLPQLSFGVTGSDLIPSWVTPTQSQAYQFIDHIVLNGTWQLPPYWAGFVEVYQDADIDPYTKVPLTIGTLMTNTNTGQTAYVINNASSSATTTGAFSIDLGMQPTGSHNLYIKFWGGTECAVNRALNELNVSGISNRVPDCGKSSENFAPGIVWPAREYSVALPLWPRMVITPSTTPAMDFANTTFGTRPTRTFLIENTGGATLVGSLTLTAPFSCASTGCGYTVNPNGSKTITVTFSPTSSPATFSSAASFSCSSGAPAYGCDASAPGGTVYQNYQVTGNSVDNMVAPQVSINRTLYNYGAENVGVPAENVAVVVSNSGGGLMNGAVTFSSVEYSCVTSCSYSLFAGESTSITIKYTPSAVGTHSGDTAVFSGGAPQTLTLQSVVNDLPIVSLYNGSDITTLSHDFGKVNVGSPCPTRRVYFRNSGSGTLTGTVTGIAADLGGTLKINDFSCVTPMCSGYGSLVNLGGWVVGPPTGYNFVDVQFCPATGGITSAWITFTNDLNPMASGTMYFTGNGNVLPIGNASSLSITFPGTLINTTITRTITISNTGVGVLSGTVAPSAVYPLVFQCVSTGVHGDSSCNYNVPAGSSTVFTFSFTPSATTTYSDSLGIPGVGTTTVRGTGVQPNFKMSYVGYPDLAPTPASSILPPSPKSYDIGTTIFGGSLVIQNKKFYLYSKNMGSGAGVNYTFHSTPHFVCLGGVNYGCSGTFPAGGQDTIVFEFQPDAPGDFTETISVDYDYGDGTPRLMELEVTGHSQSSPYLSVIPLANINLGNVAVGATSSAKFTVTNLGLGGLTGNVSISNLSATDPLSGLIHRWTFDTSDINWTNHSIIDAAGGGNTAILPGPVSAVGKYGEALKFTGSGGAAISALSGFPAGNTTHSVAMWINPSVLPLSGYRSWIALLGCECSYREHWIYNSGGSTAFGSWNYYQVQPTFPLNTWTHVVLTYDGANLKSYVNGTLMQTQSTWYSFSGSDPFTLGQRHQNEQVDFTGMLDDVRIYDRALSAAEVSLVKSNSAVSSGLVARWTFDDPSIVWSQMKILDSSGKNNHLILSPIPTSVTGKIGQAFSFNGGYDAQLMTSNYVNNPQDFSIGTWFKTSSASGRKMIGFEGTQKEFGIGSYDRHLYMGNDGKVHFGVYNGGQQILHSGTAMNDGVWHHALGTHDAGGNTALYVDGILQGSFVSGAENYGGYWRIGGYNNGWNYMNGNGHFIGTLDDARVYGRALTAGEASDLFNAGVSGGTSVFTCVSGCVFTNLASNASQDVYIDFTPTQAVGYIAYPIFASNGGNIGYPSAPYPSVSGVGVLDPMIDVFPPTLSFPITNLGLSTRQNLVITNTGLGDLIGNVSPVRSGGLTFYCYSNCNYNLSPGASTTAIIEFSPNATGTASGIIKLTSNGVNAPILDVSAFGEGKFAPIIDPRGGDTNYGKVIISKHKSQTFTLDNSNSTADLGSGTFVVTGPYKCTASADGFDVNGDCLYNLPAGGVATITITFSPVVVGGLPATTVNTGSVWLSGVPLARFFVQGIGVAPTIKFIEE